MTDERLMEMVYSRKAREIAPLIGLLVVMIVIWVTVSMRISANMMDIRRLEQVMLTVARIDTDVAYIKSALARMESTSERLLGGQRRIETEQKSPAAIPIPPTIKGMLRQHGSAGRAVSAAGAEELGNDPRPLYGK